MQVQSSTQLQTSTQVQQQTQVRKMDGSGNGLGLRDGSNATTAQAASVPTSTALPDNSTFSTYA